MPAVENQLGRQAAGWVVGAVRSHRHPLESHLLTDVGVAAGRPAQADVVGIGVDVEPRAGGDAAAALLLDAGGDHRLERGGQLALRRQAGREGGAAVIVEPRALAEDLAVAERAVRVAEDELRVARRAEGGVDQADVGLRRQARGRRAEQVVGDHLVGQRLAGPGPRGGRPDLHLDPVGHELLELEAVAADHHLGDLELEALAAGRRPGRHRPLELGQAAAVELHPAALDLAAAGVAVAQQRRHRRRRLEPGVAHQGHAAHRLAGAVEVALAVEEGGVAVAGPLGAGDVEAGGVDPHAVEVDEAEVVALGEGDQERPVGGQRPRVAEAPEALAVGAAAADHLVLVRDQLHLGAGHRRQGAVRQRPDQELAVALLGHRAEVGDQQPALRRLPVVGPAGEDPVEAGRVGVDVVVERQHGGDLAVALAAEPQGLLVEPVAERPPDAAPRIDLLLVELTARLEEQEEVVAVDPVDRQVQAADVDRLERQVAQAGAREEQALALEGHRRRQVVEPQPGVVGLAQGGAVARRQPRVDPHPVAGAGLEGAAQHQGVALGAQPVGGLGLDVEVGRRQLRLDRRGEHQPQAGPLEPRRAAQLAHRQDLARAERHRVDELLAQRHVARGRGERGVDEQPEGARLLLLDHRGGAERDRAVAPAGLELDLGRLGGPWVVEPDHPGEQLGVDPVVEPHGAADDDAVALGLGLLPQLHPLDQELVDAHRELAVAGEALALAEDALGDQGDGVGGGGREAAAGLEAQHVALAPAPGAAERRLESGRRLRQDVADLHRSALR